MGYEQCIHRFGLLELLLELLLYYLPQNLHMRRKKQKSMEKNTSEKEKVTGECQEERFAFYKRIGFPETLIHRSTTLMDTPQTRFVRFEVQRNLVQSIDV